VVVAVPALIHPAAAAAAGLLAHLHGWQLH
jgi:hypothetical protein